MLPGSYTFHKFINSLTQNFNNFNFLLFPKTNTFPFILNSQLKILITTALTILQRSIQKKFPSFYY